MVERTTQIIVTEPNGESWSTFQVGPLSIAAVAASLCRVAAEQQSIEAPSLSDALVSLRNKRADFPLEQPSTADARAAEGLPERSVECLVTLDNRNPENPLVSVHLPGLSESSPPNLTWVQKFHGTATEFIAVASGRQTPQPEN